VSGAKTAEWAEQISGPLTKSRDRLKEWRQDSLPGASARRERQIEETADEQAHLLEQLNTTGLPLLRVLAVLDRPAPDGALSEASGAESTETAEREN
jgi:hypothetical protein